LVEASPIRSKEIRFRRSKANCSIRSTLISDKTTTPNKMKSQHRQQEQKQQGQAAASDGTRTTLPSSVASNGRRYSSLTHEVLMDEKRNVQALIVTKRQDIRKLRHTLFWTTQRSSQQRQLHTDLRDLEERHDRIVEALQQQQLLPQRKEREAASDKVKGDENCDDQARSAAIRRLINQVYNEEQLSYRGRDGGMGGGDAGHDGGGHDGGGGADGGGGDGGGD
jgi:hypothetical protein